MAYCEVCRKRIPDYYRKCKKHEKVKEWNYCMDCGSEIKDNRCSKCGMEGA